MKIRAKTGKRYGKEKIKKKQFFLKEQFIFHLITLAIDFPFENCQLNLLRF